MRENHTAIRNTSGLRTVTLLCLAVLGAAALGAGRTAHGQGNPPGCSAATGTIIDTVTPSPVIPGQEVFYRVGAAISDPNGCFTSGGQLVCVFPDGTEVKAAGFGAETPKYPEIPQVQFGNPFIVTLDTPYIVDANDAVPPNTPDGVLLAEVRWFGAVVETPTPTTNNDTNEWPILLGVPVIELVKTPSIEQICEGEPNEVTYTYEVSNPGNIALTNVMLVDPHCPPTLIAGDYGDNNMNGTLDPDEFFLDLNDNDMYDLGEPFVDVDENGVWSPFETWTYTCTTIISTTTTNTATVTAVDAVGMTLMAEDTATATVVAEPIPQAEIDGPVELCPGATDVAYTVTETSMPPLDDVFFEWTIEGDALFCDGTATADGPEVCVNTDLVCDGGFTLRVRVFREIFGNPDIVCESTTNYFVSLVDTTPPVVVNPPDPTVTLDCSDPEPEPPDVMFTDNCGTVTVVPASSTMQGTCPGETIVTRTWTATDPCMNETIVTQTLTFLDTTPPTISCTPVTVECDGAGNTDDLQSFLSGATCTTSDDCSDPVIVTNTGLTETPGCVMTIIYTATFTATDSCGNAAQTMATFTIEDTTAPVITCPPDVTFECDAVGDPGAATAMDVCDPNPNVTFTDVETPGQCPQEMTTTRTWTATDACGNSSSCVQTISVVDTTPPVITCPPSIKFECDALGDPGVATATDNCDPMPFVELFSIEDFNGTCPGEGLQLRTWIATDACGNQSECIQTITIVDTTPPVITCPPDVTFECDGTMDAGTATTTDNCDPNPRLTSSDVVTPGACPQESVVERTWTATDGCGNSASCVQTITVVDTTAPAIVCPQDVTFECDAVGDYGMASAFDLCDPQPVLGFDDMVAPGNCSNESVTTRTWTATDACGNSSSCVQVITIVDTTPPAITCPPSVVYECDAIGDPGAATASDNCDAAPLVDFDDVVTPGACPQETTTTRTWSATDACGNVSTCVQTISVRDTTQPVITCPPDLTFECDAVGAFGTATAVDNCDPDPAITFEETTVPGPCPQQSVTTRTYVAIDACGNKSLPCTQTITIEDTTPPVITCPPDATFECDAVGDAGTATASDNCDPVPFVSSSDVTSPGACPQDSVITRTWIATDACGNSSSCVQTITLRDTTPPAIVCPPDVTYECDSVGNFGAASAFDTCDPQPMLDFNDVIVPGNCPSESVTTRTWTAIDACGNTSSCVQIVTIVDTTPPAITCPPSVVYECDAIGDPGAATASDNCDAAPLVDFDDVVTPGACPQETTTTRTWSATDACGNVSTCVQTITVRDTTQPVVTCPPDLTFECDAVGPYGTATAVDNCDPDPAITFEETVIPGSCPQESVITRAYIATDACGNKSLPCVQTITIVDTTPPVIACPPDATFECDAVGDFGVATATDNCDPQAVVAFSDVASAGACLEASTITRTWTATDACGNSSSCVQTITIVDTTPPVLTCPPDASFECDAVGDAGVATATDNCDAAPVVTSSDVTTPGSCPQESVITRTWTATDACGNTSTCVQTITIVDTTPPQLTCPPNVHRSCGEEGDTGQATAADNCDPVPVVTFVDSTSPGNCPQESVVTRLWTATDACGNSATCFQTITTSDLEPPQLFCPSDRTFECDNIGPYGDADAFDDCDSAPFVDVAEQTVPGVCPQESFVFRTFTATDACGNTSFCVQVITIVDTTPPVITCPTNVYVECGDMDMIPDATAVDGCDPDPVVVGFDNVSVGSCPGESIITRRWTATDACGNTSTCIQQITIVDTTPPTITCPPDATIDCMGGDAGQPIVDDECDVSPAISFVDTVIDPGLCPADEVIERLWIAVDACGNESSCLQTVTITCAPGATIGDFVWEDTDGNGLQDTGEPGLPGVTLMLFGGCDGATAIDDVITSANGAYEFTGLCAGEYMVMVDPSTIPNGYVATASDQGDDALDSDGVGGMVCVSLSTDQETDESIDFGFMPPLCAVACQATLMPAPVDGCQNGPPTMLTFRYTGSDCTGSGHGQDDGMVSCEHLGALAAAVHVVASDRVDPDDEDAMIWFEGLVGLDETFDLSAADAGAGQLASTSYIHIFDATGATLLQSVGFDTSCTQPLVFGDRFGASLLVGGAGVEGPIDAGTSNRVIVGGEVTAGSCEVSAMIDVGCDIINVPQGQLVELLCSERLAEGTANLQDGTAGGSSDEPDASGAYTESQRRGEDDTSLSGDGPCPYEFDGDLLTIWSDTATLIVFGVDGAGNPHECQLDLCEFLASGAVSITVDGIDDGADEILPCPEDVNGDDRVDIDDLVNVLMSWGPAPDGHACDINGDEMIDADDVVMIVIRWGTCD